MAPRKRLSREESLAARRALAAAAANGELPWAEGVKAIRQALGMNQEAFGKLFRLTRRQVWEIESGNANPTIDTLSRIGNPLGLTIGFVPKAREKRVEAGGEDPASSDP